MAFATDASKVSCPLSLTGSAKVSCWNASWPTGSCGVVGTAPCGESARIGATAAAVTALTTSSCGSSSSSRGRRGSLWLGLLRDTAHQILHGSIGVVVGGPHRLYHQLLLKTHVTDLLDGGLKCGAHGKVAGGVLVVQRGASLRGLSLCLFLLCGGWGSSLCRLRLLLWGLWRSRGLESPRCVK